MAKPVRTKTWSLSDWRLASVASKGAMFGRQGDGEQRDREPIKLVLAKFQYLE
jgi:hypothetical protein